MRAGDRRRIAGERFAAMWVDPPASRRTGGLGGDGDAEPMGDLIERTVTHHLAMQAQDAAGGMWSVGVRTGAAGATLTEVEAAIADRRITRSWPMRGTLHLMATRDVRWMCRLLNPAIVAARRRVFKRSGLTETIVGTARDVLVAALSNVGILSRPDAMAVLDRAGVDTTEQRGYHLLGRFCQEGLLCQGPAAGRQPTFVLLDDWVPSSWDPGREEAMAALASRYVASHGPVTVRDLAGWSGQGLTFTREAVALAGDALTTAEIGGVTYLVSTTRYEVPSCARVCLLPGFDELLLGYKDRSAMLTPEQELLMVPGKNGMFLSTVVAGGIVVGLWRRQPSTRRLVLTIMPFATMSATRRGEVERAGAAYGRFVGREIEVRFDE